VLDLLFFATELEFGAAIQRAINEWQLAYWVRPQPRLKASILAGQDDTEAAIAEIDRCAKIGRYVQIKCLSARQRTARAPPLLADLRARAGARSAAGIHVGGYGGHGADRRAAGRLLYRGQSIECAFGGGTAFQPGDRSVLRALSRSESCSSKAAWLDSPTPTGG